MADRRKSGRRLRLALSRGGEPEWELPKIPEAEDAAFTFYAPEYARWKFRSHPQEVFENTVDIAHFATVHGVSGFGELDLEHDGTSSGRSPR